ncbi:HutD/Ves family protein [Pseudomonas massiliensis]|uniref:HutD/Ves family protein n=1 Tax=Pseudomonas massiliensis TaxID=522492 RepID=UPI00058BE576|nr:HutD family protein [Pseudomonas massiliensis]
MRHLKAADYLRTPWKNGGGSTLEVCRDQGTGLDGFGWRLSIADIAEGGPFSTFAGYERVITVLEGAGMVLEVDTVSSGPLRAYQPFAFSGASQVTCSLIDGPVRDFNLIYAPERYQAQLRWLNPAAFENLAESASTRVLFAAEADVQVETNGNTLILARHDCLLLDHAQVRFSGHCALIELLPR